MVTRTPAENLGRTEKAGRERTVVASADRPHMPAHLKGLVRSVAELLIEERLQELGISNSENSMNEQNHNEPNRSTKGM